PCWFPMDQLGQQELCNGTPSRGLPDPCCTLSALRDPSALHAGPRHATVAAPSERCMFPRPDLGPPPRLGYTPSPIERAADRRNDEAFVAASGADPRAGAYAIGGELVVLKKNGHGFDPMFHPA